MNVIPQLVYDTEAKKICIQIKLGGDTATQELPDYLATASKVELQAYLDGIVPEMIAGLRAKRQTKRRNVWKKASK